MQERSGFLNHHTCFKIGRLYIQVILIFKTNNNQHIIVKRCSIFFSVTSDPQQGILIIFTFPYCTCIYKTTWCI